MALNRVMRWNEQHKLHRNVEKCSHISMCISMLHFTYSVTLIEKVHILKDLGVYVTNNLKWGNPQKKVLEQRA